MPILSRIGRRSLRARLGMAFLYGLLILGALTTLGPFVVMVSTAFKGPTDQNDHALIPRFFSDPAELAVKYRSAKSSADENRIAVLAEGPASISAEEARDFGRFLENLPTDEWTAGFRNGPGQVTGRLNVRYQAWLRTRYATIGDVNAAYAEISQAFAQVSPPPELFDRIGWNPKPGRKWDDWSEFKQTLPAEFRIPLTRRALWIAWLKARTSGRIGELPPAIRGDASAFEQAAMPEDHPWYAEFRAEGVPERFRGRLLPDEQWVQLTGRPWPWTAWENAFLAENRSGLTREFAGQNFAYILDFIALNGRALWNTLIFCLLAVAVQLIVNPLCAYAISRHPGPWMSRLLLILLATMAFPAEVAMIPAFLLLKDFGLLNTFAALVLPGAAAGFSIFLLKGFFDSLPQELFEAGRLDGAGEFTLMARVALPLSRPVLGYIALLAFMGSYGAFMFAFLVVQKREMWTLMVFIYQMQGYAPKAVMMAALTLAAVPTLLVFLAAQRVIMRGIVLPGER